MLIPSFQLVHSPHLNLLLYEANKKLIHEFVFQNLSYLAAEIIITNMVRFLITHRDIEKCKVKISIRNKLFLSFIYQFLNKLVIY